MRTKVFKTIKVFLVVLLVAVSFVLVFDPYGFRSFGIYLAQWHIYSWIEEPPVFSEDVYLSADGVSSPITFNVPKVCDSYLTVGVPQALVRAGEDSSHFPTTVSVKIEEDNKIVVNTEKNPKKFTAHNGTELSSFAWSGALPVGRYRLVVKLDGRYSVIRPVTVALKYRTNFKCYLGGGK